MATNNETKTVATKATTTVKTPKETTPSKREVELEAQMKAMMETIAALQAKIEASSTPVSAAAQPTVVVTTPTTDVSLVYLSDSLGCISTNNTTLNCTRFGEEFVLSRSEFDAIVGKYRKWFDDGILAISYKNVDVAAAKGIKTDKEYNISADVLSNLGTMSVADIEKLWNETADKSHKLSIVTYFKKKFIEDTDPAFRDRAKIDLFNRLTDGGFRREADELSSYNRKIQPTEF